MVAGLKRGDRSSGKSEKNHLLVIGVVFALDELFHRRGYIPYALRAIEQNISRDFVRITQLVFLDSRF